MPKVAQEEEVEAEFAEGVELLEEDELLVELELRGLIDPGKTVVTPKLKKALAARFKAERVDVLVAPYEQHAAAMEYPELEVAICQMKLWAVQRFLLEGIRAGITLNEMYPKLKISLLHVRGRINRSAISPVFRARSMSLYAIIDILWDMVAALRNGRISLSEVAEKLSRVTIKIDPSIDAEEGHGMDEEQGQEQICFQNHEVEIEGVANEEEPEEEPIVSLGDVGEMVEADSAKDTEEVGEQEVEGKIEEDEVKTPDVAEEVVKGGTGDPEKGYTVVLMRAPIQTKSDFCGQARDKGLKCTRIIAKFRAWYEWLAVPVRKPVDRLSDVLDLRLEDEVLAKANRRVFYEDVSGFSFC